MDQYVGEIRMFAGDYAPVDWLVCDGSLLSIAEYQALYTLLGTTYGGDGVTKFALPDLRGRLLIHQGKGPSSSTNYLPGQAAGTEQVTLLASQLATHSHQLQAQKAPGNLSSPSAAYFAQSATNLYSNAAPTGTMQPSLVTNSGGGLPHDNVMPSFVINFIIATQGNFPASN